MTATTTRALRNRHITRWALASLLLADSSSCSASHQWAPYQPTAKAIPMARTTAPLVMSHVVPRAGPV